jgi:hypothetical protein
MQILSPVSARLGALIGGGASLCAAIYTQRYQNRLQRVAGEIAKREAVYADFVMDASNVLTAGSAAPLTIHPALISGKS